MNKTIIKHRERIAAAALGSVRAEGFNPPKKAQKRLLDYAEGKISITELRQHTLNDIKAKTS